MRGRSSAAQKLALIDGGMLTITPRPHGVALGPHTARYATVWQPIQQNKLLLCVDGQARRPDSPWLPRIRPWPRHALVVRLSALTSGVLPYIVVKKWQNCHIRRE